jgi:hypothetical protein
LTLRSASLAAVIASTGYLLIPAANAKDTVKLTVGAPLAHLGLLKPGVHRYVRYVIAGDKRSALDIWTRTVAFEQRDGQTQLHISMRWDEVPGRPALLTQDSWFEANTFRPLTHVRHLDRVGDGKIEVSGYRFLADRIEGLPDLPDNLRKDFSVESPEPSYNFEYDMELLQTLPLSQGFFVSIPFYDPAPTAKPPARYIFKVAGSDRINAADGHWIQCWLVTADYNSDRIKSRFWFDKKSHLMIREEQTQDDGSLLIKTLLSPESADVG